MKKVRFIAALVAVLLLFCGFLPREASALTLYQYSLSALRMKINVPDTLAVFTRDVKADDPNLARYNMTAGEMKTYLKENDIYLYMVPIDTSIHYEYIVSMDSGSQAKRVRDFATCGDEKLLASYGLFIYAIEGLGGTISDSSIEQIGSNVYVIAHYSIKAEEVTMYACAYWTICNSQSISIILKCYNAQISDAMDKEQRSIMDSVTITRKAAAKKKSKSSSGNSQKASFLPPAFQAAAQS